MFSLVDPYTVETSATPEFDREYLWNGSSNQQAKNGLSTTIFATFHQNNLVNFGADLRYFLICDPL